MIFPFVSFPSINSCASTTFSHGSTLSTKTFILPSTIAGTHSLSTISLNLPWYPSSLALNVLPSHLTLLNTNAPISTPSCTFPPPIIPNPTIRPSLATGGAEIDFALGAAGYVDCGGMGETGELDTGYGDGRGAGVPEDGLAGGVVADEVEGLGCGYEGL
ncbi:MAG: hypothetical protein L6R36_009559 [Xanthoria steineri]|nr:MAG: hypothetical protein L6R36_009559 [Xanthoria steineri]